MTLPVATRDMVYENGNLVLSGTSFASSWYESTGVTTVRIAAFSFNGASLGISVMDGQGGTSAPNVLRTQSASGASGNVNGDFEITGRYFMFELTSGFSGDTCMITVRAV